MNWRLRKKIQIFLENIWKLLHIRTKIIRPVLITPRWCYFSSSACGILLRSPIWLKNVLSSVFLLLEAVMELGMAFSALVELVSIVSSSSNRYPWVQFPVLGKAKSSRGLCRNCTKSGDAVWHCVLLHKIRWMRCGLSWWRSHLPTQ